MKDILLEEVKAYNRKFIHVCSPGGHSTSPKSLGTLYSANFIKSSPGEGGTS